MDLEKNRVVPAATAEAYGTVVVLLHQVTY